MLAFGMNGNDAVDDDQLSVPVLTLPEFKARIPDHLLEGLSKRDHHTLTTLHLMAEQVDWLCSNVITQNEQMRRIERDHIRIRRWKELVASKWSVIVAIILLIAPLVVSKLIDKLFQ